MSRTLLRPLSACAVLILLLVPRAALAHEHITVGEYELVIGWVNEPVLLGEPNGLDLSINRVTTDEASAGGEAGHEEGEAGDEHAAGEAVTGVEETLTFEVEYGGVRQSYPLRPVFGQPGAYTAELIPTREGQYTFHFSGDINGEPVEITVEPQEVTATTGLEFPEPRPSVTDLVSRLEATQGRLEATQAQASTAQVVALVAVVVGLVGAGLGAYGLRKRSA